MPLSHFCALQDGHHFQLSVDLFSSWAHVLRYRPSGHWDPNDMTGYECDLTISPRQATLQLLDILGELVFRTYGCSMTLQMYKTQETARALAHCAVHLGQLFHAIMYQMLNVNQSNDVPQPKTCTEAIEQILFIYRLTWEEPLQALYACLPQNRFLPLDDE